MKIVRASTYIFLILLFANVVFAGLPPTTTKASGDASNFTTFKFLFPNFTVTRSGINTTFNVNSVAGGGTGLSSTTAYMPIVGGTSSTSALQSVATGTTGQFLTYNGSSSLPTWTSGSPSVFAVPSIQRFTSSGTYNKDLTFIISSGNATAGATYTNNGNTFTVLNTVASATQVVMIAGASLPTGSGTLTKATGTGDATLTFSQYLAPLYIKVSAVGPGGGGGGSGSSAPGGAGSGTATTFGSIISCPGGGAGGALGSPGGSPGAAPTISSLGTVVVSVPGGGGGDTSSTLNVSGGVGGSSFYGGGGAPGIDTGGNAGSANTGGGGGGAGGGTGIAPGGGGGSGSFAEVNITGSSLSTITVTLGTVGSAGTPGGGGNSGGAGGSGVVIVSEFYQ